MLRDRSFNCVCVHVTNQNTDYIVTFNPSAVIDFYRRQILTSKVVLPTGRVKVFMEAVDT